MKRKGIDSIINTKFNNWLKSIDNEALVAKLKKNTIMTGGAIASLLQNEMPNDFDFYFRDYDTALAVATYYVGKFQEYSPKFKNTENTCKISVEEVVSAQDKEVKRVRIKVKSAGIASDDGDKDYQYFESVQDPGVIQQYVENSMDALENKEKEAEDNKPKYRPVFLSSNAVTLSDGVQLIIRFYGEPSEIHANYDFIHCTNYWTSWDKKVVYNEPAMVSLMTKELRYVGSKYPLSSLIRVRKFVGRGWQINAGQMLKMIMQVHALNLTNIGVLEEQLTGVDVAYFHQILDYLKEHPKNIEKPDEVDGLYLAEIIDKMF